MLDADDVPCVPLDAVRRTPKRAQVVLPRAVMAMRLRLLTPRVLAAYRRGTSLARICADNGITDGSLYRVLRDNRVPLRRAKGAK